MKNILRISLILVALLAACRHDDGAPPPARLLATGVTGQEQTTIRFAIHDWEAPAYKDLIATFEEENADLRVQVVSIEQTLASVALEGSSIYHLYFQEGWLGGGSFWLARAYSQIVSGEAGVEEALAAAQELADDYRACVVASGSLDERAWQRCVLETDPTVPPSLFGLESGRQEMRQRLEGGRGRSGARSETRGCHLAAWVLILLPTHCSAMQPASPSGAPRAGGRIQGITTRFAVYDGQEAAYRDLIDAFEAEKPVS